MTRTDSTRREKKATVNGRDNEVGLTNGLSTPLQRATVSNIHIAHLCDVAARLPVMRITESCVVLRYRVKALGAAARRQLTLGIVRVAKFKHAEHLLRLAAVFVAGLLLFIVLRAQLVPHTFGQYGHYRGDALAEVAARPVSYAGHKVCEDCHADVLEVRKSGKHAGVNCEACHGPLAKHAEDPGSVVPKLPDTAILCARCHTADPAKPADFPQVTVKEHAGDLACNTCHKPHSPSLPTGEKKK